MPLYEYKCSRCGKEFEELIRSADQQAACPDCGSADCCKQFSVFGFSAGNGFVSSGSSCSCNGCSSHRCSGCK